MIHHHGGKHMPKYLRHGHAPGHVRDTAIAAFDAWLEWDRTGPEPTVEFEVNYEPRQITISRALGMVWNCTDIVLGGEFDELKAEFDDLEVADGQIRSRTYGACAQFILRHGMTAGG
jgi:hypothetical protein